MKMINDNSPLWKHCSLEHNRVKVEFAMKPLRGFTSCLEQQVNEAVRVTGSQADVIHHEAPITRVIVASGLYGEQGESQDPNITSRMLICLALVRTKNPNYFS